MRLDIPDGQDRFDESMNPQDFVSPDEMEEALRNIKELEHLCPPVEYLGTLSIYEHQTTNWCLSLLRKKCEMTEEGICTPRESMGARNRLFLAAYEAQKRGKRLAYVQIFKNSKGKKFYLCDGIEIIVTDSP